MNASPHHLDVGCPQYIEMISVRVTQKLTDTLNPVLSCTHAHYLRASAPRSPPRSFLSLPAGPLHLQCNASASHHSKPTWVSKCVGTLLLLPINLLLSLSSHPSPGMAVVPAAVSTTSSLSATFSKIEQLNRASHLNCARVAPPTFGSRPGVLQP
jgi:hypothetical protein